jgi:hypothetical protein
MGLECWPRGAFGGTGKIWKTIAAASLIVALSVATSRAGDVSAQPADSLSVTNSVNNVLPQAATPPPGGGAESWLNGLHISGYGTQTFGMWQDPPNLRAYTPSRNNLAVARSLLQIDNNYRLNENNTFFARLWFAYEPPYSYNSANNSQYVTATVPAHGMSYGHRTNGFYNTYELRDAWWQGKFGPLDLYLGNQIIVWGQSLAFRVGDVVNPANTCWAFGFANLEQSRVPQWMIHPILNLPEWGQFTSNFLELIVQPGFQPNWQPNQYEDPLRKYRSALTAGRADPCLPAADHGPSGRFDVQYPTQPVFGADYITSPIGPYNGGGAQSILPDEHGIVATPAAREFWICLPNTVAPGWNPYTVFLKHFHPTCNLGLSKNNNFFINSIGDFSAVDVGRFQVPGMQPENWNEGVRFHSLYGLTEFTALYYNDNVNGGGPASLRWYIPPPGAPFTNLWYYQYPDIQEAGVTVDRPLPVPAAVAEYFPAVMRGEFVYQNHESVDTTEFQDMNGQRWSDVTKYMLAIDLDQAYAPWLTSTGNLTANLEYEQTTTLDDCKMCWNGNALDGRLLKNDVDMLFNVGTSWWWADFAPTWTMLWNPKGDTFAMFPSIVLNPPWTKKYFMSLQAIEVLGGDKMQNFGLFKGESYLIAQFQYNFDIM